MPVNFIVESWYMGVVTVLIAIGSAAREAPAQGCGVSLMTNNVSGGCPHVANRQVECDGCGGSPVTNDVSGGRPFVANRRVERWR